jgi:hypothetical protein
MAGVMTAGQFLMLCEPGLAKVWHDDGTPRPLQHPQVLNIGSISDLYEEEAEMAGFGPLQPQAEGESLKYDEAIAPRKKRWDYVDFALGYKVTDKLVRNERYGDVAKMETDLRRSADDTTETFAFALLNFATTDTIATGFDGLPLASTAHPRMDGGAVQANRPTVLTALSLSALQDSIISFRRIKNERGRPFIYRPKHLNIPPELEMTAIELLGSQQKPGTNNNDTNAVTRFGINYRVLDYIPSTTYWSLQGESHDLRMKWRYKAETGSEVDFDTNTIKRKVRQGMLRGFGNWRGYYQGNV